MTIRLRFLNPKGLSWFVGIFLLISLSGLTPGSPELEKNLDRDYAQAVKTARDRWQEGSFEAAFSLFGRARELAERMEDGEKEARILMDMARLTWVLNQEDGSRELYFRAREIFQDLKLEAETELCRLALRLLDLYNSGRTNRLRGRLAESSRNLEEALQIARRIRSPEHEVKCLRQLSLTMWAQEERDSFLSLNLSALLLAKKLQDLREQMKCLSNLGMYFFWRKDYVRALDHYSQSLELARETRSRPDESLSWNNISLVLMRLGFYEKSAEYLEKSVELYSQPGNAYFMSQAFNNLAQAYRNKGLLLSTPADLVRAIDYLNRALEAMNEDILMKTQVKILNNLGQTYLDLEKHHTARHYLEAALERAGKIRDEEAHLRILVNLGAAHLDAGDSAKAREYLERALELEKGFEAPRILWEIYFNLGRYSETVGEVDRALSLYERALEVIDRTRVQILADDFKAGFMRNKFRVYESLIDLRFKLYENTASPERASEIFHLVERAKARAFLETLGEIGAVPGRPVIATWPEEKEKALSSSGTTQSIEGQVNKLLPAPLRLEPIQASLLDDRTALLEYFLGEKRSLLFLLTKSGLSLFVLPGREEIRTSLSPYLVFLSRPPRGDWDWLKASRRLSRDLLGPVWENLPASVSHLIIVPDDILFHLPFETLALPRPEDGLLLQKYSVSYAPSSSSLLFLQEKERQHPFSRLLLGLGNPSYRPFFFPGKKRLTIAAIAKTMAEEQGLELTPLVESKREIRSVGRYFPEDRQDLFLEEKASEETLKSVRLEDYEVIHLACHGYVDEKVPFRSGLFLAIDEDEIEDGFLQASEIVRLRLAAELVVLSACQTGRGYLEKGEGIMGLTRAFFYAGARSVLSTLWKISDRVTAEFMDHFYASLSRGKGKGEALREAKLRLLESPYAHPFYWAAFVLHGEAWRRIRFN